jgi:hypothetical protein
MKIRPAMSGMKLAAFAEASNNDSTRSIYDVMLCACRAVDRYNQGLALGLVEPKFGGDK